ncbi:hypothetical protein PGS_00007030 [Porphyromonas gingivalis A7A1-28]|nr:hypothetical protein PGS_00007030 [Porphyromonas gingivalis A7A1-28]
MNPYSHLDERSNFVQKGVTVPYIIQLGTFPHTTY